MSPREAAPKRPYRMKARAKATKATRERILDAVEVAFEELQFDEITLTEIATRAGVSVQTVLRHFENKDTLFLASFMRAGAEMAQDRGVLPSGDLGAVVGNLVDHYEKYGTRLLRMLAQEDREPTLKQVADLGRIYHVEWCRQAFSASLKGLRGAKQERRLAQLVTATDIYVWKLLRLDRGLSRPQTKVAMVELLEPLTKATN
jgi:AcrR family transcriptional regulator